MNKSPFTVIDPNLTNNEIISAVVGKSNDENIIYGYRNDGTGVIKINNNDSIEINNDKVNIKQSLTVNNDVTVNGTIKTIMNIDGKTTTVEYITKNFADDNYIRQNRLTYATRFTNKDGIIIGNYKHAFFIPTASEIINCDIITEIPYNSGNKVRLNDVEFLMFKDTTINNSYYPSDASYPYDESYSISDKIPREIQVISLVRFKNQCFDRINHPDVFGDRIQILVYYSATVATVADIVAAKSYSKIVIVNIATQEWTNELFVKRQQTVTHYCPIEKYLYHGPTDIDEQSILKTIQRRNEPIDFKVGQPCFASGNVYKLINNKWIPSTENDSTDCICSVKNEGSWKEFVGVITSIDANNYSLTFATHGDFLFRVDNSDIYNIGDTILYDGTILDESTSTTYQITRSIVGVVTARVGKNNLAIFKT